MNRILLTFVIALAFVFPTATFASTVTLSPTSISVTPGKVFTVSVTANPDSGHLYTVRTNLSFNPALVQVTGFKFAPKWLAISATGYDVTDNTKGLIVKTAGYPGGITSPTIFGTVTFKAKKAGTAYVSVTTKSMTLDENSKNTLSGTQGVTAVMVKTPVYKKPVTKKHVTKTVKKAVVKTTAVNIDDNVATTSATTTNSDATNTQAEVPAQPAAAETGASSGGTNLLWWIIGAVAVVIGGVWAFLSRKSS
ncbi:MAG TPA: hypothetical protein ENJ75_02215 [Candidatus Kaiserbacteria bacterium]|nr:hypothetical protein [Candidatus Kaiserbacteria bacterium]